MPETSPTLTGHELYYFRTCPFCIKVLIAMRLMGIKMIKKNIHSDTLHKAELIRGGGKKQVPCLRIEKTPGDVEWLYESSDIINYLKGQARV